jgi:hypothetical protein
MKKFLVIFSIFIFTWLSASAEKLELKNTTLDVIEYCNESHHLNIDFVINESPLPLIMKNYHISKFNDCIELKEEEDKFDLFFEWFLIKLENLKLND